MHSAFRVFEENGRISGRVVAASLDDLDDGAVLIKAAFSSVNYKDALAGTGAGKIMRRFPLIGGIDVAAAAVASVSLCRLTPNTPVATAAASKRTARRRGSWPCSDRVSVSNASARASSEVSIRLVAIGSSSDWCDRPGTTGIVPTVNPDGTSGGQDRNSKAVKSGTAAAESAEWALSSARSIPSARSSSPAADRSLLCPARQWTHARRRRGARDRGR